MKKEKQDVSIIRSSAAEYLTFITATGKSDVNAIYFDENVWLTQKMMGILYNVETHTINYHLKKIFADGEIDEPQTPEEGEDTPADEPEELDPSLTAFGIWRWIMAFHR